MKSRFVNTGIENIIRHSKITTDNLIQGVPIALAERTALLKQIEQLEAELLRLQVKNTVLHAEIRRLNE